MPKANTVNRNALRRIIAKQAGTTIDKADTAIDQVVDGINACLLAGQSVKLLGFGVFHVTDSRERAYSNPVGGQGVTPARRRVRFAATAETKRRMNEGTSA
jgi:nucleoid DNA-binding protein